MSYGDMLVKKRARTWNDFYGDPEAYNEAWRKRRAQA